MVTPGSSLVDSIRERDRVIANAKPIHVAHESSTPTHGVS
jgi:hypothetical protein